MELNRTIYFNWLANMPNMLNDLVCQDRLAFYQIHNMRLRC